MICRLGLPDLNSEGGNTVCLIENIFEHPPSAILALTPHRLFVHRFLLPSLQPEGPNPLNSRSSVNRMISCLLFMLLNLRLSHSTALC